MVKFCDKCGAELNDNVKFCDKCGAEVKIINNQSNNISTPMGAEVICPHCKQSTPMGLTHCKNCGSSLEDNTTAVIVGYIVTFLIPIFGLIPAIYLLTRENGKAKTQGVLLIGLIIINVLSALIFGNYIIQLIIMIIFIIVAIYLWFNDFNLF